MIQGHGDDIYDYAGVVKHNFSSNVYHAIQMPGLAAHLRQCIDSIGHYPPAEAASAERLLSIQLRIGQQSVLVTNGATEGIYLIAQATGTGCRSAIMIPTFSEYEDACRMHGHRVEYITSLGQICEEMNVVWLCNPNNPTGRVIPKQALVEVMFRYPNTVFVVDQSYEYFCREELLLPREAAQMGNVLLLHSMTKKYSIPGLRLGYATGPQPLIQTLRGYRMPWSVNVLAQQACCYLVEHAADFCFDINGYLAEAQHLNAAINGIDGMEALPTQTHFMTVRIDGGDSILLKRQLMDRYGILIRSAHNFAGLDRQYIRVAAQSAEENNLLVEALKTLKP